MLPSGCVRVSGVGSGVDDQPSVQDAQLHQVYQGKPSH